MGVWVHSVEQDEQDEQQLGMTEGAMDRYSTKESAAQVAACTAAAAHRRDHHHGVAERDAEALADSHRTQTLDGANTLLWSTA